MADSLQLSIDLLRNNVRSKLKEQKRSDLSKTISGVARIAGNIAKTPFSKDFPIGGPGFSSMRRGERAAKEGASWADVPAIALKAIPYGASVERMARRPIRSSAMGLLASAPGVPEEQRQVEFLKPQTEAGKKLGVEMDVINLVRAGVTLPSLIKSAI